MNAFVSAALRRSCPTVFTALVAAASFAPVGAWAAAPNPAPTVAEAAAGTATTPATSGDNWRFVRHNNQWWYYQPNGQWLIHDGSAWRTPEAFAQTAQVYQPARSYNSQAQPRYRQFMGSGRNGNGMANDGFWGNSARYWTYQHVLSGQ